VAIQFGTATRRKAKLRLGIMGPSGSGKSWGALEVAGGLASAWDKVFVVDTERGSASLYAQKGAYQVAELSDDFSPATYTSAIKAAEGAGAEVIVLDSLSHAWEGVGGALDMVEAAQARSKSGNSFTAWKEVTPAHRALVDAILQSTAHIIVTLRVKTEYVIEKDERGKSTPRKVGLAPIQRAGLEYELGTFFDVDEAHMATVSKDRTGLFDGKRVQLSKEVGKQFRAWLDSGAEPLPQPAPAPAADLAAATDSLLPWASKLQAAETLDALKAAWESIPNGLKPALEKTKNEVKSHIMGVK
jgi:hypothetical protein